MSSTSAYDIAGRLVETSVVIYRADRYRMRTAMTKRQPHQRPLFQEYLLVLNTVSLASPHRDSRGPVSWGQVV
jgi:hypothetical protein